MGENTNDLRKKVAEFYKQNKFKEIIELLTDALLEEQKDAVLYAWRSRTNYRFGANEAVNMFFAEKAIAIDPNYFMGYFVRALIRTDREEYDKAIKDYTKAIELNMDFADAYYNRGVAWQSKKENDKAIADYDKAIADYDKAIANYNKDIEIYPNYADAYNNRGYIWYFKTDYDKAIADYTKAIENNPDFADAHYNRGLAWVAIKEYNKAIDDYTKAIEIKPDFTDVYYYDRGNARKAKREYKEAINDYTDAINKNSTFENAYYYRGLTRYESKIDIEGSKQDFQKYLDLTSDEKDIGVRYAEYYLKKLDEINDFALTEIKDLVFGIKEILRIGEDKKTEMETTEVETFVPKPFIGSFVTKDKHNDLNMWRFYGKEDGVEAKGCAIVLRTQEFIEDIKNSLSNEKNKEARMDDESDINFYRVVYLPHNSTHFKIPKLKSEKLEEFKVMMNELKIKVTSYKEAKETNITSLEEYLNIIAFLFKRDDYENENEVRLVMTGIEFEKKFCKEDKSVNPPRVYIELEPIRKSLEQITLGPKVDKANEWASTLHYSYKGEEKAPIIEISHLPYK